MFAISKEMIFHWRHTMYSLWQVHAMFKCIQFCIKNTPKLIIFETTILIEPTNSWASYSKQFPQTKKPQNPMVRTRTKLHGWVRNGWLLLTKHVRGKTFWRKKERDLYTKWRRYAQPNSGMDKQRWRFAVWSQLMSYFMSYRKHTCMQYSLPVSPVPLHNPRVWWCCKMTMVIL